MAQGLGKKRRLSFWVSVWLPEVPTSTESPYWFTAGYKNYGFTVKLNCYGETGFGKHWLSQPACFSFGSWIVHQSRSLPHVCAFKPIVKLFITRMTSSANHRSRSFRVLPSPFLLCVLQPLFPKGKIAFETLTGFILEVKSAWVKWPTTSDFNGSFFPWGKWPKFSMGEIPTGTTKCKKKKKKKKKIPQWGTADWN